MTVGKKQAKENGERNNIESTFRLWVDFLREKKAAVCLFLVTAFLFLLIAFLYHVENLAGLFYGILLAAFFWLLAGFLKGRKYVARRRQLQLAQANPEQLESILAGLEKEASGGAEEAYLKLARELDDLRKRDRDFFEEQGTARNDYYLMWAHQIKTPISAMKLLIGEQGDFLLKEELFKIEQYVEMALYFQRLETIETDLLFTELDLYTLLKQAARKYSVLFINKCISLQLSEMSMAVLTDEKWFCFCVEQILSNCIKYAEKGKGVVSLFLSETEPDTLIIKDNGIGIRPEDLPRIFERGFTGYNGRMDKKSTGIGLYLCRQILTRLGIEIRVESAPGVGTEVHLKLPKRQKQLM